MRRSFRIEGREKIHMQIHDITLKYAKGDGSPDGDTTTPLDTRTNNLAGA
jgi:hypothetical protein